MDEGRVGALDRSLDALTRGLLTGQRDRHEALAHTRSQETEQQVQVPLVGEAANGWGFTDVKVGLELPFVCAPAQRLSNFTVPHFGFGIEFGAIEPEGELVIVHASVMEWVKTPESWITGAKMRFASSAPMTPENSIVQFQAVAHLRFQGYAVASEEGDTG